MSQKQETFQQKEQVVVAPKYRSEMRGYGNGPFTVRQVRNLSEDLCAFGYSMTSEHDPERCPCKGQTLLKATKHHQTVRLKGIYGLRFSGYHLRKFQ